MDDRPDDEEEDDDVHHGLLLLLFGVFEHIPDDQCGRDHGPYDEPHSIPEDAASDDPSDRPSNNRYASQCDEIHVLPETFRIRDRIDEA